jgi:hypothetical protein
VVGAWLGREPEGLPRAAAPSAERLARAEREIRLVLGRTAGALRRAEQAAVREVLAGQVAPALRRIPIRLPGSRQSPDSRGDP